MQIWEIWEWRSSVQEGRCKDHLQIPGNVETTIDECEDQGPRIGEWAPLLEETSAGSYLDPEDAT